MKISNIKKLFLNNELVYMLVKEVGKTSFSLEKFG